jgi:hypothetical protein
MSPEDLIKTVHFHLSKPTARKPGGVAVIGHYRYANVERDEDGKVIRGTLTMCRPNGTAFILDGRRFQQEFHNRKSGELNEHEVARALTLEIRSELQKSIHGGPDGFGPGPLQYRPSNYW